MSRIYPPVIWTTTNSPISQKNSLVTLLTLHWAVLIYLCLVILAHQQALGYLCAGHRNTRLSAPGACRQGTDALWSNAADLTAERKPPRYLLLCIYFFFHSTRNSVSSPQSGSQSLQNKNQISRACTGRRRGWSSAWGSHSLCKEPCQDYSSNLGMPVPVQEFTRAEFIPALTSSLIKLCIVKLCSYPQSTPTQKAKLAKTVLWRMTTLPAKHPLPPIWGTILLPLTETSLGRGEGRHPPLTAAHRTLRRSERQRTQWSST